MKARRRSEYRVTKEGMCPVTRAKLTRRASFEIYMGMHVALLDSAVLASGFSATNSFGTPDLSELLV